MSLDSFVAASDGFEAKAVENAKLVATVGEDAAAGKPREEAGKGFFGGANFLGDGGLTDGHGDVPFLFR